MANDEKCLICRKPITENLVRCPYCNTGAHKDELQNWIRRHGTCPRCGRELKPYAT